MNVWIGTAGYSYPAWVGGFYPKRLAQDRRLRYYATHFPLVEINSSFHRPPTVAQAKKMAAKVPADFRFVLKVPQSVSHRFDRAELPAFRLAVGAIDGAGQLAGLLVQVAESFHNTESNREWLAMIRNQLRPYPLAVEFRHVSWDVPAIPGWIEKHDFQLVGVGVPDIPTTLSTRVTCRRLEALCEVAFGERCELVRGRREAIRPRLRARDTPSPS